MLIKVFSVLSMLLKLSKLSPGVFGGGGGGGQQNKGGGGGSNMLPGLVTKQQAVEFPQVLTSAILMLALVPLKSKHYCWVPKVWVPKVSIFAVMH